MQEGKSFQSMVPSGQKCLCGAVKVLPPALGVRGTSRGARIGMRRRERCRDKGGSLILLGEAAQLLHLPLPCG